MWVKSLKLNYLYLTRILYLGFVMKVEMARKSGSLETVNKKCPPRGEGIVYLFFMDWPY